MMTARRTRRRRTRRQRQARGRMLVKALCLLAGLVIFMLVVQWWSLSGGEELPKNPFAGYGAEKRVERLEQAEVPPWITPALLEIGNARNGQRLEDFTGVVIHYVGNPGTTAMNNRNYFAKEETEVCSHFVVGLEGEIVQCVPLWERSAASNQRNRDTVSVEVCHPDEGGEFNDATYASLVRLVAWLCDVGGLDETDVIRHYDVTGKQCPIYYVTHEDAWQRLRGDIAAALSK